MNHQATQPPERDVSWIVMMGILAGRLITISTFLIILSLVIQADSIAFYAFIAFAYIITIPYSLWMRNQDRVRRLAPLQFLVDLVFVSGLIYFAYDTGSDFLILLYPLVILSAGIILPLKQTVQITILAIICYALISTLVNQSILAAPISASPGVDQPLGSSGAILLRIVIFVFFGIVSAYVSRRCDYISRKERQFREITQVIFEHVKTGLLLLDGQDRIIMANLRACELLGSKPEDLCGQPFNQIRLKPAACQPIDAGLRGASEYFRHADGSVFPVSIEDATVSLPTSAIRLSEEKDNRPSQVRIVSFTDLSSFLSLQNRTRHLERLRAAAEMASEMARQIRTPLTGISAVSELLQRSLNDSSGKNGTKERHELCRQMIDQTTHLDKIIQSFLNYADFSPEEGKDLLKLETDLNDRLHRV